MSQFVLIDCQNKIRQSPAEPGAMISRQMVQDNAIHHKYLSGMDHDR